MYKLLAVDTETFRLAPYDTTSSSAVAALPSTLPLPMSLLRSSAVAVQRITTNRAGEITYDGKCAPMLLAAVRFPKPRLGYN
ncbi:hypothetical protein PG988_006597 [Apiospora saccharicola]